MGTFERTEVKYLLTKAQYDYIFAQMCKHLSVDRYGLQCISNEYFDTDDFRIIRTSIDKPKYKEKLRIRSYGKTTDFSNVFFELKKKYNGVVFKRRLLAPLAEVRKYAAGQKPKTQIGKEIRYFIDYYGAKPKIFLAYDRIALQSQQDKSLRITFDSKIRSRFTDINITHGDYGEYLFEDDIYVMEIKSSLSMPIWMSDLLAEVKVYPTSFSKCGEVYKKKLRQESAEKIINQLHSRREGLCLKV